MSVSPDRIACPRCGSNNFATQAACWKCGSSLVARSTPAVAPVNTPPPSASHPTASAPQAAPVSPIPAAMPMAPRMTVDPAIAIAAAIALGIFFPWFAVPAGLIFLMLDDRRKAQLGKITLVWGLVFTLLHLLLLWPLVSGPIRMVQGIVNNILQGQRQPGLNDPVEPIQQTPPIQFPSP